MKFGKIPLDQAAGTILAHSTRLTGRIFKKGHFLTPEDIVVLQNSGITEVIAARLESEDILEDVSIARTISIPMVVSSDFASLIRGPAVIKTKAHMAKIRTIGNSRKTLSRREGGISDNPSKYGILIPLTLLVL